MKMEEEQIKELFEECKKKSLKIMEQFKEIIFEKQLTKLTIEETPGGPDDEDTFDLIMN